ncbi:DinB family protein [Pontibacter silvestris]|uniref:DinB family protein n=1 Tax=Pontibacter silvestris TaxID=2305183 RepID=A0ABW4X2G3_9BACT|nr:DinB family protein [Pontibacter silvestris]MCC9138308.1 DinB family protein [Pontibacter silvestris]
MNYIITPPSPTEYDAFFKNYVEGAQTEDLLYGLEASGSYITGYFRELPEEKLNYHYAPGKWSIKEILVHLMDTERIFAYRALRFARHDETELSGFDQDRYIVPAKAAVRAIASILQEFIAVRLATIELFRNFDEEALSRTGIGSGKRVSVRALGYSILGHEIHHLKLIKERCLKQ